MVGGGKSKSRRNSPQLSTEYLSSVKAYWEGRPRTCIERLATTLSMDPSPDDVHRLYRLWIECLAHQNEILALRTLLNHFSFFIEIGPDRVTNMALKGMVHFELDEINAAALMHSSIAAHKDNPYVWELAQKLRSRGRLPESFNYQPNKESLVDFFLLQSYFEYSRTEKLLVEESFVKKRIYDFYPNSPFIDFITLHDSFSAKNFSVALSAATRLVGAYALNQEFSFARGFALTKLKRYADAIAEFERAIELHGDQDVDILNWLGYALSQLSIDNKDLELNEKAKGLLQKSIDISTNIGVPVDFPLHTLQSLNDDIKAMSPGSKVWLLKVSSQEYSRIRTDDLDKVRRISATIGEKAGRGDYCFIFGDDHNPESGKWRFGALYQINSDTKVNHGRLLESSMSLVDRPIYSIPIDVEVDEKKSSNQAYFEFDLEGIEQVAAQISEYLGDESLGTYGRFRRVD